MTSRTYERGIVRRNIAVSADGCVCSGKITRYFIPQMFGATAISRAVHSGEARAAAAPECETRPMQPEALAPAALSGGVSTGPGRLRCCPRVRAADQ